MAATDVVADEHADALRRLGRVGYVAYALVHVVLAVLVVQLALGGTGGEQASTSGALARLAEQPFGAVLLGVVGVGLLLMALWQALEAWLDDAHGVGRRLKHAGKAVFFAVVAAAGLQLVLSSAGSGGSGGSPETSGGGQEAAGFLFGLPGGRFLVAGLGVGILAIAAYHLWEGVTKAYLDHVRTEDLSSASRRLLDVTGRVGYCAKGLAYGVVGGLFLVAAAQRDSSDAGGLDQALQTLKEQPFGPTLLVAVGAGFGLFALFCLGRARARPA